MEAAPGVCSGVIVRKSKCRFHRVQFDFNLDILPLDWWCSQILRFDPMKSKAA